jgi:hypothetical protein
VGPYGAEVDWSGAVLLLASRSCKGRRLRCRSRRRAGLGEGAVAAFPREALAPRKCRGATLTSRTFGGEGGAAAAATCAGS